MYLLFFVGGHKNHEGSVVGHLQRNWYWLISYLGTLTRLTNCRDTTVVVADLCTYIVLVSLNQKWHHRNVSGIPSLLDSRGYCKDWLKLQLNLLHRSKGKSGILTDILFLTLSKSRIANRSYVSSVPQLSMVIVFGVLDWKKKIEMLEYWKETITSMWVQCNCT